MNFKQYFNTFPRKLGVFILIYLLIALCMYWVVADDWSQTVVTTDSVNMTQLLPENAVVEQRFVSQADFIDGLTLTPHFNAPERSGSIRLSLHQGDTLLAEQFVDVASLVSDAANSIPLSLSDHHLREKELTLTVDPQSTGMALWSGNTMSAGKFDVAVFTSGLSVNGEALEGSLVFATSGYQLLQARGLFGPIALVLLTLCVSAALVTHHQMLRGKRSPFTVLVSVCGKYKFLVKQLVSRDFNVKYKSSMLGVVWSFLNPLLTMLVYLFVFSTIFKSNIEHFPVYLMSGIVLFNYFSESTSLGLAAITGNSSLITKVYMPKVIYPLSKILSSAVNLCISFIPLFIVMILTGVPFHKSMLLLPLVVGFLLMFSLGVSLILSTMNVFFRDTQFLWGVVLTMLNFLTPVFYPESIIPAQFQTIYHMNPMYQILFFMRSITLGGVSPTPITYLYCLLVS
ncbi:MAG: ABC transporter permease, partial [Clostridia bacterium]|nr:ABC transporter permease [Clostridia bacterium]